ncbi:LytR family transcriptional regulator [bacterium]|nr:MAG: LytR family transcriptional regulator [bacterium]
MKKNNSDLFLNSILGFLGLLLILLLFAVLTRVVFPRIENTRDDSDESMISSIIQVEVLNGCGVPGLATTFTNKLRENGFDVVESGNADTFDIKETLVVDRSGNLDNAKKVAKALGVSDKNVIQELASTYFLDATIIIGSDYKQLKLN